MTNIDQSFKDGLKEQMDRAKTMLEAAKDSYARGAMPGDVVEAHYQQYEAAKSRYEAALESSPIQSSPLRREQKVNVPQFQPLPEPAFPHVSADDAMQELFDLGSNGDFSIELTVYLLEWTANATDEKGELIDAVFGHDSPTAALADIAGKVRQYIYSK